MIVLLAADGSATATCVERVSEAYIKPEPVAYVLYPGEDVANVFCMCKQRVPEQH
jgi:hypothetical protein